MLISLKQMHDESEGKITSYTPPGDTAPYFYLIPDGNVKFVDNFHPPSEQLLFRAAVMYFPADKYLTVYNEKDCNWKHADYDTDCVKRHEHLDIFMVLKD